MRILVVGATGLLGKEIIQLLSPKHEVIGASRNGSALKVDLSDQGSIVSLYNDAGPLDAVICVGGTAKFAPLDELQDSDYAFSLANKLMGQVNLVRCGAQKINPGGSITLTSGTLAQHPMPGGAAISLVNAGIEAFARTAALELRGMLRVNVVSPGWVAESMQLMGRDATDAVRASVVAQAYRKCVEESISGQVVTAAR